MYYVYVDGHRVAGPFETETQALNDVNSRIHAENGELHESVPTLINDVWTEVDPEDFYIKHEDFELYVEQPKRQKTTPVGSRSETAMCSDRGLGTAITGAELLRWLKNLPPSRLELPIAVAVGNGEFESLTTSCISGDGTIESDSLEDNESIIFISGEQGEG